MKASGNSAALSAAPYAALGVAILACMVFFPRLEPFGPHALPEPAVSVAAPGGIPPHDLEVFALNDATPLFTPTKLNFSPPGFELPKPSPVGAAPKGESPETSAAHFKLDVRSLGPGARPQGAFAEDSAFSQFGRVDSDRDEARTAYHDARISVVSAENGVAVFSGVVDIDVDAGGILWPPVEMTVVVNSDGAASEPFAVSLSGVDSLDKAFEAYLRKNIRSMGLKPGYYRVIFAP